MKQTIGISVLIGLIFTCSLFVLPWKLIKWGTVSFIPGGTLIVSGTAKSTVTNRVAEYSAGVTAYNDNKQKAIDDVNEKISTIISSLKTFGIAAADIKTENVNVYQSQENYYEEGRQKTRPGQWHVDNSIRIRLIDVTKSSELMDILTQSGATNIYGPNYSIDDTQKDEQSLLGQAILDAHKKAEIMAKASGKTLGQVLSVSEGTGGNSSPIPLIRSEGMGGGGPTEPGSATIEKSVTVTFELN